jgi:acyl-CoA reductase-like NAD-dependent aldehyde dehydrogenase
VSAVRATSVALAHPDAFFIGGQWVRPSSTATIDVVEPSTEQVFLSVAEAAPADMDGAVTAARRAFDHGPWPRMTHAIRAGFLRAMAEGIRRRSSDLSRLWTSEMGILHAYSQAGMPGIADIYDYYAGFADSFEFVERHQPAEGNVGFLIREPVGVVGAIVPWNAPLALIAYKTAPALIAGCVVVLKSSPEAPGEAYVLAEIAEEIGLPPGVLNVLTADREVSETLVSDSRVDKITFTGSTVAGRRIGSILGGRIARYTLELGGKSAAVVLDDYDVGAAAASIAATAPVMTGQVCSSLTRIIVSRGRHDALVEALVESFGKVRVGDPFDQASGMGPLAMRRQRDRVEGYIAKGVAEGARLVTGGGRPAGLPQGFYVEPTVFASVDNSFTIAQEEIFGPVLSVIPADDETQALEIANDTVYGLNASVYTNDPDRAMSVARRLRSGTVGHNSQRTDFTIAFGGVKQSGVGREGGREGILPFLEPKTVILDSEPSSTQ